MTYKYSIPDFEKFNFEKEIKIGDIIYTSNNDPKVILDYQKQLKELGVIPLSSGRFSYRGESAKAIEKLRNLSTRVANKLDFELWYLPKIVPTEIIEKFGILRAWPAYLLRIYPQKNIHDSLKTTIQNSEEYCLDPVQCASLYETLYHLNLNIDLPIKMLDISGYTYRNEFESKLSSTIKSMEFLRAEYVIVGENVVTKYRYELLMNFIRFVDQLNLPWRLVVGSGCYDHPEPEDLEEYKKANEFKQIPVIDLEIYSKTQDRWIEVVGATHMFHRKLERYNLINSNKFESGCVGIGFTRLLSLLFEYLGPETETWAF